MSGYLHRNHILYCDNWFTSVPLFDYLRRHSVLAIACGTIRPNRKQFSKELVEAARDLPQYEYLWRQSGELCAYAWMDRKAVFLLSTSHSPDCTDTVSRRQASLRSCHEN
jgi:hypothetical protein